MEIKTRLSRPPLARMLDIHDLLKQGRKTNRRLLSEGLEVSAKTIQRDIDFMRDQLGLPIEYDVSTHSYFYTRNVVQFPTVQISEGELVALTVAKKALAQYQGTSFEKPLKDAFEKLTSGLRDQIHFAWREEAGEAISFRAAGQSIGDLGVFEAVSLCVLGHEEIEFTYRKLERDQEEARTVQPLHLASIDQQWYLFGFDLQRMGRVRTFALTRMSKLHRTGRRFEAETFSLDDHLAGSFGVFSSATPERIVVKFDEFGGRLVRERIWHASQQIEDCPDGGLQLALQVGVSPEIERWILGWGEHAEVLAPLTLRTRIGTKSAQVAALYKKGGEHVGSVRAQTEN